MACRTPTGTTFVLATQGAVGNIISIDGFFESITEITRDLLSDAVGSHRKYCPGEKVDHEPLVVNVEFDPDDVLDLGTVELATLTFPPVGAQTEGAALAGTGFLRRRGFNSLANDTRIEGVYEFRFNGDATPPAYSEGE